ncbi:AraC family transcriptional regulator ligand-binding domain-containing protein [Pseudomonas citronellolis]|uniref:AraC family transcriptional regulator n=1 Tax=Pseudomonas citronellolis TaxID=53408 RepID=UPI0026495C4F|nr:AraC family transcriptional regulator ligand-binding domain-containing protein [Pseudomonas citronellolis]MDN6874921.1 AraC family transcriptional regulator ligand-binding domain-containing protein [Pseudomonas citronellolis]
MEPFIRTTSFTGFRELVAQRGQDPLAYLERFRIKPQLLDDEDARVPFRSLVGLLEYAAAELDCPDFGLRMAAYQNLHVLGPIAAIARHSVTVAHALADVVRFIGYHSPGIQLELDQTPGQAPRLCIALRIPGVTQQRQMAELAMGVTHNTMTLLCGPAFKAQAVELHGASPLPLLRYRRYFRTEVRSGQAGYAMLLTQAQLQQRIEQQDPTLHRTLVQYLSQFEQEGASDLGELVRRMVMRMLPTQRCRLPLVAEQMGLHERTLQRRLGELGQTFEEVVEGVRRERAQTYLAARDIPLAQIANMLGYSEQAVFNRACRRWFDVTPGAYRRQLLGPRA